MPYEISSSNNEFKLILPKSMVDRLCLNGEQAEVKLDGNRIIIQRIIPYGHCTLCGSSKVVLPFENVFICQECIKKVHDFGEQLV